MTNQTSRIICGAMTRSGQPCAKSPLRGQARCRIHGGSSPQALAAASRRLAIADAAQQVAAWGGRRDVAPGTALLELVQTKAAEVAYWQHRVSLIDEHDLTWGLTKNTAVQGPTHEAKPHIALTQLHETQRDLAAFAAAALKAGVEERTIRLAEDTARQLVTVLTTALSDTRLGITITDDIRHAVITDAIRELT